MFVNEDGKIGSKIGWAIVSGALLAGLLGASPAAAESDNPQRDDVVKQVDVDGTSMPYASRLLTVDELKELAMSQSPAEAAVVAAQASTDQHVQTLLDFSTPGTGPRAAVLVPQPEAGPQASPLCTTSAWTRHRLSSGQNMTYAYCANSTWEGARGGWYQSQNVGSENMLVGLNNLTWEVCSPGQTCMNEREYTLGYVRTFN
ncbi:hypothetical protein [Microbacterium resistens]